jgi:hypothetical protein
MRSRDFIIEGNTKAFKARISYYKDGKIGVFLSKLGPFFWDAFKHEMFIQEHLAEKQYAEYCKEAERLAEADV